MEASKSNSGHLCGCVFLHFFKANDYCACLYMYIYYFGLKDPKNHCSVFWRDLSCKILGVQFLALTSWVLPPVRITSKKTVWTWGLPF